MIEYAVDYLDGEYGKQRVGALYEYHFLDKKFILTYSRN